MKTAGIITEYNPFHNGHAYQVEQIRAHGVTHLAAVMSGHFVQRGDLSCFDKWTRAEAALRCGVDLVVELPTPYAMSPATDFAYAGVSLLQELQVETLYFGSECGDTKILSDTLDMILEAEQHPCFKGYLEQGISHPKSRELTVKQLYNEEAADVLRQPNNMLGLEYLRAVRKLGGTNGAPMTAAALPRTGAGHDLSETDGHIASASHLRRLLYEEGIFAAKSFVPEEAYALYMRETEKKNAPVFLSGLENAILYRLRTIDEKAFSEIADVAEGLHNRIKRATMVTTCLDDCIDYAVTSRYTRARIRRIMLNALLDIRKMDFPKKPPYLRVLACNRRGMELLGQAKIKARVPITPKFSQLRQYPLAELEAKATDIYTLAGPKMSTGGEEYLHHAVIIKD